MRFWVDMDNAPHVHMLRPIIQELEHRGHDVTITAREYGQTIPLLRMYGLRFRVIGRHPGKSNIKKHVSFATRSLRLLFFAMGKRFDGVFCHGARSAFPVAHVLRIPLIVLGDYEHAAFPRFMCRWVRILLTPDVIPADVLVRRGFRAEQIRGYPGLKEDLYVHGFEPDASFFDEMGIDRKKNLVLLRPPATMAHYAVVESEALFFEVLDYLCGRGDVELLLLPRTNEQREELKTYTRQKSYTNLRFPDVVYNGPNLIWNSDLVISGGGTMNREAASLGIPVVSIYQGPIGAVDSHLIATGRLTHVRSLEEMKKIKLEKFSRRSSTRRYKAGLHVRDFLVDQILWAAMEGKHRCEP